MSADDPDRIRGPGLGSARGVSTPRHLAHPALGCETCVGQVRYIPKTMANSATPHRPPGCPPATAAPPDGTFFRLVSGKLRVGEAPGDGEWVLPVSKPKGECAGATDRCDCHAHSVFADVDDLRRARTWSQWVRSKAIASLQLRSDMGLIEASPSDIGDSHNDWWPINGDPPEALVVEEAQA